MTIFVCHIFFFTIQSIKYCKETGISSNYSDNTVQRIHALQLHVLCFGR